MNINEKTGRRNPPQPDQIEQSKARKQYVAPGIEHIQAARRIIRNAGSDGTDGGGMASVVTK
jgi:hypothetical protein